MKCTKCGIVDHKGKVLYTTPYKNTLRRTRKCSCCGHKWYTYEATEPEYLGERNRKKYLKWTPYEEVTAVRLKEREGKSNAEIGRLLGRSRMAVTRHFDKMTASKRYFEIINYFL